MTDNKCGYIFSVIGGLNGVVMFGCSCMSSIVLLPSPHDENLQKLHEKEEKERQKLKAKSQRNAKERRTKID